MLIRDKREPAHFVSIGTWDDPRSIDNWRGSQDFAAMFQACVELCEGFHASDYTLAASADRGGVVPTR